MVRINVQIMIYATCRNATTICDQKVDPTSYTGDMAQLVRPPVVLIVVTWAGLPRDL